MFEFSSNHIVMVALGVAILLAYWLPRFVSGREPAASALLIGLGLAAALLRPDIAAGVDPVGNPHPWELASELTVIIGLFGVGISIDRLRRARQWRATTRLLLVAMPVTIAAVAFAGWAVAGLSVAAALLLGAVLAPTDPVLAGEVQVGKPTEGGEHPVRFALTTEAGLNDGLAFPFVYLGLAAISGGVLTGVELFEWAWRDVAWRIGVGAAAGVAVGWLLGRVLFALPRGNALATTESGVVALAGVLAAYGLTELAEGYGFIAAFVAGVTVRRIEARHEFHGRLHSFAESLEHALTAVLLVALGAALPGLWPYLGLNEAAVALLLLFVIRPLAAWACLGDTMPNRRERLVVAFYGVRGIGSIYYLAFAGHKAAVAGEARMWAIIACAIVVSTIVHGFTAGLAVERVEAARGPV